ncbi:RTX N-terminal domain protein, partial [Vibrio parahaemolyticus VPTS-2010]
VQQRN